MARIDLQEDYAVRQLRQAVRDSLMSHGEQGILLQMYHPEDEKSLSPAPKRCTCFDDIYQQSEEYDCEHCYGTTFEGGIRQSYRGWMLFTDSNNSEDIGKRGVWSPTERNVQMEATPELLQRDYLVRVSDWTKDYRPVGPVKVYVLSQAVNPKNLRTGAHSPTGSRAIVGQKSRAQEVNRTHPLYKFPWESTSFARLDGNPR